MFDRNKVREILAQAVSLPVSERGAYLDRACGADEALRAEVQSLLVAVDKEPDFMAAATKGGASSMPTESLGALIGPYKLLEQIGHGGFGTVYLAEQDQPVRRRVALKIIKLGMDTQAVIARFEAERQALAMMDHAHIAKVFDAGTTDPQQGGRPYFVMELVRGEPITAYADHAGLTIPERLDLFLQVCHALQHAHSKGIIHRDIKPGNVLVTTQDGRPHAKVIDFGIAKATDQRLTDRTLFTEFRQLVGTPEYMSPEQAGGAPDVDTRSDVYSLGVLLYELLTGATPFESGALRAAAYDEIQRIIREVEPPKPSTRLSRLATLANIAALRRTEPARLSALVTGDLDWIVMKALDKDRGRRYETASAFAADIQHHLTGEPVAAAPPSMVYRSRKFVLRNQALVASGAAVLGVLLIGIVGTTVGLVKARAARIDEQKQRAAAQDSAARAEANANRASAAEARATARADELERVAAFQASQLAGIDPAVMGWRLREDLVEEAAAAAARAGPSDGSHPNPEELGKSLAELNLTNAALRSLYRNIFQRALAAIDTEFKDQPLVAARLLQTCGDTLGTLGLYEEAIRVLRQALEILGREVGQHDARTLKAADSLGYNLTQAGRLGEAEECIRAALDGRRRLLGEDSSDALASLVNLGFLRNSQGKFAESEDTYRDALARLRRTAREIDATTHCRVLGQLAVTVKQRGRPDEAEGLMRESLDLCRHLYGEDDAKTLTAKSNLAAILHAQKKLPEATQLALEVLESSRRALGDEHPSLIDRLNNLGVMYAQQNKLEEALTYQRDALTRLRRRLGEYHPSTLTALNNLGVVHTLRGQFGEAAETFSEGVQTSRRGDASTLPIRAMLLHHQAEALTRVGKLDDAKPAAREAVDMYRAHPDWNPAEALHADQVLEVILVQRGDDAEAEPLLRAAIERDRRATPVNELSLAGRLETLGNNLLNQHKYTEAEAAVRECLAIRERVTPEGHVARWRLHLARSALGSALVGQAADQTLDAAIRLSKLREAEPLLIDSFHALSGDPHVPPKSSIRRTSPLRVVQLYETWDQLEPGVEHAAKAAQWRTRVPEEPMNPR